MALHAMNFTTSGRGIERHIDAALYRGPPWRGNEEARCLSMASLDSTDMFRALFRCLEHVGSSEKIVQKSNEDSPEFRVG